MSDSATLLAYLHEHAQPDGSFAQNANTTAALLGWYPDRLSEAYQELAEAGSVEATHKGGDPAKVHGASWRVLEPAPTAGGDEPVEELDGLKVPELRELAKSRDVDITGLKKKDEIVAKLRSARGDEPVGDEPVDLLSELTGAELVAFAKEHSIEVPEHSLDDPDTEPTDAEMRHAIQSVLDIRALEDAANGRIGGEAA